MTPLLAKVKPTCPRCGGLTEMDDEHLYCIDKHCFHAYFCIPEGADE